MQDVVEDIEVVEKFEVLKHEANIVDAKGPTRLIRQRTDLDVRTLHLTLLRHQDAGDQVQQRGLAEPLGPITATFSRGCTWNAGICRENSASG